MTGNSQKTSDPGAVQGIMLHNTVKHTLVSGQSAFRPNHLPGNMYSLFVKQTSVSLDVGGRGWVGLGLRSHAASACLLACMRSHYTDTRTA